MVVFVPNPNRFVNQNGRPGDDGQEYRKKLLPVVEDLNIPTLDISGAVASHPHPLSLYNGHFNARGYEHAAGTIMARLDRHSASGGRIP